MIIIWYKLMLGFNHLFKGWTSRGGPSCDQNRLCSFSWNPWCPAGTGRGRPPWGRWTGPKERAWSAQVERWPNTKSRFWSKKNLKRKWEFWSENEDLGVFDIADFKFLGLGTRFERNWRNWFWIFENGFQDPKCRIRNRISDCEVPISYFSGNRIFPKSKFQILAESVSAFSSHCDPNFVFCGVYV